MGMQTVFDFRLGYLLSALPDLCTALLLDGLPMAA